MNYWQYKPQHRVTHNIVLHIPSSALLDQLFICGGGGCIRSGKRVLWGCGMWGCEMCEGMSCAKVCEMCEMWDVWRCVRVWGVWRVWVRCARVWDVCEMCEGVWGCEMCEGVRCVRCVRCVRVMWVSSDLWMNEWMVYCLSGIHGEIVNTGTTNVPHQSHTIVAVTHYSYCSHTL